MSDLATRLEITKLTAELEADEGVLDFLEKSSTDELRELRATISAARFARQEERFRRIASFSRLLPVPITARIAQIALGPMLSARVASVLEVGDAVRLAKAVPASFLAELSVSIDPLRVAPIVSRLPESLIIEVGRLLLDAREHLVLGRFVSVASVEAALGVIEGASGLDLLRVGLLTEDQEAMTRIVERLSDDELGRVIKAAARDGLHDDAITFLAALGLESRGRLIRLVAALSPAERSAFLTAIIRNRAWDAVLPSANAADDDAVLASLVNIPETLDVEVMDTVIDAAQRLDLGPLLVRFLSALDSDHIGVLKDSKALADPAVQEWLKSSTGVDPTLATSILKGLGIKA